LSDNSDSLLKHAWKKPTSSKARHPSKAIEHALGLGREWWRAFDIPFLSHQKPSRVSQCPKNPPQADFCDFFFRIYIGKIVTSF